MPKTYSAKPSDITRNWYVVDASKNTLGRVATKVATLLQGKHKPSFSRHIDCGDHIIVINAANLKVTGNKLEQKKYYRHSGFPGGIKETKLADALENDPTKVVIAAVKGMLPKNKLMDKRLERLKVYTDENHGHEAQKPKEIEV